MLYSQMGARGTHIPRADMKIVRGLLTLPYPAAPAGACPTRRLRSRQSRRLPLSRRPWSSWRSGRLVPASPASSSTCHVCVVSWRDTLEARWVCHLHSLPRTMACLALGNAHGAPKLQAPSDAVRRLSSLPNRGRCNASTTTVNT